jgi:mono/diheme cytochrome c family protein
MKEGIVVAVAALVFAGVASTQIKAQTQTKAQVKAERVERGRYLVSIAGCHDCHSPKVDGMMTPDSARLLSGRPVTTQPPMQGANEIRASLDFTAFAGPWGNSYAANLTPDSETGIGSRYDEAAFIKTIRTGKKPEGEALAPPMPWPVYAKMTDEDLKAVFAYLRTIQPVKNFVRASPVQVTTQH